MKKTIYIQLLMILYLMLISLGCNSEDAAANINSTPEFQSLVSDISTLPGEIFVFEGTITDPAGISTINFKYEPWFLDKTIERDSISESYEIFYRFKVPEDAEEFSSHTVPVTITNIGGVVNTSNVIITLDDDINAPTITVNEPTNGVTIIAGDGDDITIDVDVDDRELSEFRIESSILEERIMISGPSFNYSNTLDVEEPGDYTFEITALDAFGNEGTATVSVSVVQELRFNTMFLTDETSDEALNSDLFGIPFNTAAIETEGETGFEFTGRYYSAVANSELRFIPQETSFAPFSFGADPNNPGQLILGQDSSVTPIVVPGVGYYEITVNVNQLTYEVTPYTPTDDAFGQVYIIGRGIYPENTASTCVVNNDGSTRCFHFSSGKPFNADTDNEYLWSMNLNVRDEPNETAANAFILNANPDGWAPFWRTDPNDASITIPGGGSNYNFAEEDLDKDYTFTFDTHLNRLIARER